MKSKKFAKVRIFFINTLMFVFLLTKNSWYQNFMFHIYQFYFFFGQVVKLIDNFIDLGFSTENARF